MHKNFVLYIFNYSKYRLSVYSILTIVYVYRVHTCTHTYRVHIYIYSKCVQSTVHSKCLNGYRKSKLVIQNNNTVRDKWYGKEYSTRQWAT